MVLRLDNISKSNSPYTWVERGLTGRTIRKKIAAMGMKT